MFLIFYILLAISTNNIDFDDRIALHHLRNPCEVALLTYPTEIASSFPEGVVVPFGDFKNLFCECETNYFMLCTIIIPTHSKHEKFIREKLDAHDPENMKPFFIYPEFSGFTIAFIGDHCDPKVVAEIKVERGIHFRSQSAPPAIRHYPAKAIPYSRCTCNSRETVCPILQAPFQRYDVVCVLKSEELKLAEGKDVSCISLQGLRKLAQSPNAIRDGGFVDPLRREGERLLNIDDDYERYVVLDDDSCRPRIFRSLSKSQQKRSSLTTHWLSIIFFIFFLIYLSCFPSKLQEHEHMLLRMHDV